MAKYIYLLYRTEYGELFQGVKEEKPIYENQLRY